MEAVAEEVPLLGDVGGVDAERAKHEVEVAALLLVGECRGAMVVMGGVLFW